MFVNLLGENWYFFHWLNGIFLDESIFAYICLVEYLARISFKSHLLGRMKVRVPTRREESLCQPTCLSDHTSASSSWTSSWLSLSVLIRFVIVEIIVVKLQSDSQVVNLDLY